MSMKGGAISLPKWTDDHIPGFGMSILLISVAALFLKVLKPPHNPWSFGLGATSLLLATLILVAYFYRKWIRRQGEFTTREQEQQRTWASIIASFVLVSLWLTEFLILSFGLNNFLISTTLFGFVWVCVVCAFAAVFQYNKAKIHAKKSTPTTPASA